LLLHVSVVHALLSCSRSHSLQQFAIGVITQTAGLPGPGPVADIDRAGVVVVALAVREAG